MLRSSDGSSRAAGAEVTCDVCGAVLGDAMAHLQWHVGPADGADAVGDLGVDDGSNVVGIT
jgi:hypothetical protein